MSAAELLERLRDAGVDLWADGERLRYDAPAESLTEELLERLRAHKPEILALVRAQALGTRRPLGPAQEGFWLLDALHPKHAGANEQFAIRIEGPLEPDVLAGCWQELLDRHAVLRARFGAQGGMPWQEVGERPEAPLERVDLAAMPEHLRQLAGAEAVRRFDLVAGNLVRAILVRLGEDMHVLLVTVHHIIADGRSVAVIRDDLAALYAARMSLGPAPAPAPQYLALVSRERAALAPERLAPALDWWRERLAGAPARHGLPEKSHAEDAAGAARRVTFTLDAPLAGHLRALARERGVTLFTLLLASLRVLLARCTGQQDVLLCSPVTTREESATRGMVGCLINMLVFRTPLASDLSFTEHLGREHETVVGALAHRMAPFVRVVEVLGLTARAGGQPLSQLSLIHI